MQNQPRLSALFTKHGSDKNTGHSYGVFYDELAEFLLLSGKPLHILEIGVDQGGGIKALHEFFKERANLYGVDRNVNKIQPLSSMMKPVVADLSTNEAVVNMLATLQSDKVMFDLIIDDASHAIEDQLRTVEILWPILAPGGYIVVEDLQHQENAKRFVHFPGFRLIDLRDVKGRCDDMLIVMRKSIGHREMLPD